jgi:two-component system, OmpR family, alkaline phosphatase synthesis response regulator PhoP
MSRSILIVEDDVAIATALALNLRLAGHSPSTAADGEIALREIAASDFDLVLLDINLPKKNGLEVLEAVRGQDMLVPVIVLSARDGEFDKVAALRLGADDYVTKPFALAELLARIDAVLRRTDSSSRRDAAVSNSSLAARNEVVRFGDVEVDLIGRSVQRGTTAIHLTHLEFELLAFFLQNPRQVFPRQHLFEQVWGQAVGSVRTVDNFIAQLRKHLEADPENPRHLVTVRGAGYRLDP